jgi:hypothetical protein
MPGAHFRTIYSFHRQQTSGTFIRRSGRMTSQDFVTSQEALSMAKLSPARVVAVVLLTLFAFSVAGYAQSSQIQTIRNIMGTEGTLYPDGVLRFDYSRSDISYYISGTKTLPDLAAEGYFAFKVGSDGKVMLVGEMPLQQTEVWHVETTLATYQLDIPTALHNHWLYDNPRLMFLHFSAVSSATDTATLARNLLHRTSTPWPQAPKPEPPEYIDVNKVKSIMHPDDATVDDGVLVVEYDFEGATMNGRSLPPEMGPQTEVHFQGLSAGKAMIVVEMCVTESQLTKVTTALANRGFLVTAIHNHFVQENPRLKFVHAQVTGDPYHYAESIYNVAKVTSAH